MPEPHDPRTFFAAERTLLSWVRTGIATVGLGFVVARFGLFLRLVGHVNRHAHRVTSTVLGVGLMLVGVAAMIAAAVQHRRFLLTLGKDDLPRHYSSLPAVVMTGLLGVLGLALAVYLAFWGNPA